MSWFLQGRSPVFLFVALGVSVVVLHCGGADTSAIIGGDEASTISSTEGGGATSGDGGAGTNKGKDAGGIQAVDGASADGGAPKGDAGPAVIPDGGAQPTPTGVSCGTSAALCDTTTSSCCAFADGGTTCVMGATCSVGIAVKRECDEPSDCPTNQVCCYEIVNNDLISSSCHADCNGGGGSRVTACRQQSDCTNGACAVHACQGGGTIESCGSLDNQCQ